MVLYTFYKRGKIRHFLQQRNKDITLIDVKKKNKRIVTLL